MSSTIQQAERWERVAASVCAGLLLLAATAACAADNQNPHANDPKAAKAGESEFRINCALCHGLGRTAVGAGRT